jgi:hypothetical protein
MKTMVIDGVIGTTVLYTVTDSSTCPFTASDLLSGDRKIVGAIIECDANTGNSIRYAFGVAPAVDTKHFLAAGSVMEVLGYANCSALRVINDVALSAAKLWITPKY